eukprot:gnl/TRDRNA2_/TRDRNA2_91871_c0_seq1.p1 gnl/TRDRNA2_/TRDRNA2_91871_c0~~gnl/TRDRNA2_/TRDRNA2_91871_c0_seq1.p1  ORF type:complete len:744 (+),score=116.85 gnl/TRDRNA2_/TRDRNA2_91871_c0_seq1:263-2233(+)
MAVELWDPGITHLVIADEVSPSRLEAWAHTQRREAIASDCPCGNSSLPTMPKRVCIAWLVECAARQVHANEAQFKWPCKKSMSACSRAPVKSMHGTESVEGPQEVAIQDESEARPHAVFQAIPNHAQELPAEDGVAACLVKKVAQKNQRSAASKTEHEQNGAGSTDAIKPVLATQLLTVEDDTPPEPDIFGGAVTLGQARLLKSKSKFACQRRPAQQQQQSSTGKNHGLVSAFKRLQEHYEALGDQWRQRSYRQAATVLRGLPFELERTSDLDRWELRRLGKKTRDKIREFLETGSIGRAKCLDADKLTQALEELQDIWGVGLTTARRLLGKGCYNVADVRRQADSLSLNSDQLTGLRYFEEFRQRMPRAEVDEILSVVRTATDALFGGLLRMEACGSYRRGQLTCGDVDVLFSAVDAAAELKLGSERQVLSQIVRELHARVLLTDDLKGGHHPHSAESHSAATYFGVCQLPGPGRLHRRLDLKVYPVSEWPFALLSFTGSGPFNRSMRLFARRAGFSLSDHDIRPANHARGIGRGERIWTGQPVDTVEFRRERDIFAFLGLSYREPAEREVDAPWLAETGEAGTEASAEEEQTSSRATGGASLASASACRPHIHEAPELPAAKSRACAPSNSSVPAAAEVWTLDEETDSQLSCTT